MGGKKKGGKASVEAKGGEAVSGVEGAAGALEGGEGPAPAECSPGQDGDGAADGAGELGGPDVAEPAPDASSTLPGDCVSAGEQADVQAAPAAAPEESSAVAAPLEGAPSLSADGQSANSTAPPEELLTHEEVYDALLAAALDSGVSGSARRSLGKLAQAGSGDLARRAATMIAAHARALSRERKAGGVQCRAALYKVLASMFADSAGGFAVPEEVACELADLATADLDADEAPPGMELEGGAAGDLRGAAVELLVQLARAHGEAVLARVLPRIEGATMFQQQQAQRSLRAAAAVAVGGAGGDAQVQARLGHALDAVAQIAAAQPEAVARPEVFRRLLAAFLPCLATVVAPPAREAWAAAVCACCAALRERLLEQEAAAAAAEPGGARAAGLARSVAVGEPALAAALVAAYDVLESTWAGSREPRVVAAAFLSLAAIAALLPPAELAPRLPAVLGRLAHVLAAGGAAGGDEEQRSVLLRTLRSVLETGAALPGAAGVASLQALLGDGAPAAGLAVLSAAFPTVCAPPDVWRRAAAAARVDALAAMAALARALPGLVETFLHRVLAGAAPPAPGAPAAPAPPPLPRGCPSGPQGHFGAPSPLPPVLTGHVSSLLPH